jgi:hypothetical protein
MTDGGRTPFKAKTSQIIAMRDFRLGKNEKDEFAAVAAGGTVYNKRTGKAAFTAPDRPLRGPIKKDPDAPKPLTKSEMRLRENDATGYAAGVLGGRWDSNAEKLVDAAPGVTDKFAIVAPQISRLVRQFGDKLGAREIADMALSAYGDVKSLPEYEAEAASEADKNSGFSIGYKGNDAEVEAGFPNIAKVKQKAALAVAAAQMTAIESRMSERLKAELGDDADQDVNRGTKPPPKLQSAIDSLPQGKQIRLKDGTIIRKNANGEPVIIKPRQ